MSKTILSEVDGWTPLIDALTREHGLLTSAVFSRIWRYCQGEQGVCSASLSTIAHDLGIDRSSALRHAKKLVSLGYLKDLTPDLRHVPHTYADTGKAGVKIVISGSVAEDNSSSNNEITVAENNRSVAQNNSEIETVAQGNATVAESHLKIDLKKEDLKRQKDTNDSWQQFLFSYVNKVRPSVTEDRQVDEHFQKYMRLTWLEIEEEERWVIACPDETVLEWMRQRFRKTLERELIGFLSRPVSLEFILDGQAEKIPEPA